MAAAAAVLVRAGDLAGGGRRAVASLVASWEAEAAKAVRVGMGAAVRATVAREEERLGGGGAKEAKAAMAAQQVEAAAAAEDLEGVEAMLDGSVERAAGAAPQAAERRTQGCSATPAPRASIRRAAERWRGCIGRS